MLNISFDTGHPSPDNSSDLVIYNLLGRNGFIRKKTRVLLMVDARLVATCHSKQMRTRFRKRAQYGNELDKQAPVRVYPAF